MRRIVGLAFFSFLIGAVVFSAALPATAASRYEAVLEAVVVIRNSQGLGTGFFINNRGRILTNRHVVGPDKEVTVKLRNGRTMPGRVLHTWSEVDLALVGVDLPGSPFLNMARSDEGGVGDEVIAVGTPRGLSWSVSRGIISSIRQDGDIQLIQTDAAINAGNSGGPLILLDSARVIGVNTRSLAKDQAEGISFALSANTVKAAFARVKDKKFADQRDDRERQADQKLYQSAVADYRKGDYAAAGEKWTRLSKKGYSGAQYALAGLYEQGRGVDRDYRAALHWYRQAAESGNSKAMGALGAMYVEGRGVEQDYAKAAEYFQAAAERGNVRSMYNLGVCHSQGRGLPQNHAKAIHWYTKAAKRGYASAMLNLGVLLAQGKGAKPNLVAAHMWLNLAAARGSKKAAALRDKVAGKMSREQVDEAQKRAGEWRENR